MARVFLEAARRSALAQIRYVTPVRPGTGPALVARVYDQVEREFGMLAPPVALHAPAPDVLAACWLMLRETLIAAGRVDRVVKETVGTAVSASNACPYCVEVHSATRDGLVGGDRSVADPGTRDLVAWATSCGNAASLGGFGPAPFPAEQAPELIGVAVTFHYLNRMVNVFLRESPFPAGLPAPARGRLLRLLVRILRPATLASRRPGDAAELLPAAALPEDLAWATGSRHVAEAFARASATVEAAAARCAPAPVRELVRSELAGWYGDPPGASRAWVEDAVSGLPAADRPAARLALLTALASYQVGPGVVDECRAGGWSDEALIGLTSWASLLAARRVGSWTWDALRGLRESSADS